MLAIINRETIVAEVFSTLPNLIEQVAGVPAQWIVVQLEASKTGITPRVTINMPGEDDPTRIDWAGRVFASTGALPDEDKIRDLLDKAMTEASRELDLRIDGCRCR